MPRRAADGEIGAAPQAGEPYADNLRRFYRARLDPQELPWIEIYVAEGVGRRMTRRSRS